MKTLSIILLLIGVTFNTSTDALNSVNLNAVK